MTTKAQPKEKRKAPKTAFGPNNPPPLSLGRPVRVEPVLEPGVPLQLAAMRAAANWSWKYFPKNAVVKLYIELRRASPGAFSTQWSAMEKAFLGSSAAPVPVSAAAEDSEAVPAERERIVDEPTERVVAQMEEWLAGVKDKAERKWGGA